MSPLPEDRISIVVVSRGRPAALRRCLMALEQQIHPGFEVVVVADADGCRAAATFRARVLPFARANVAAARNAGIAQSAGGIVAFIDDDAAAEPTWLARLTAPFADSRVAAAGGHVLGRNGISLQWGAREVDDGGFSHSLALPAGEWSLPRPTAGRAVRVEGTNMAFRKEELARLGGFDPDFAFYHDETDLCWRLARAGGRVALVPGALVHHGMLPSERRRADRMPRDLWAVGAGSALFLRRHAPARAGAVWKLLRAEQRARLLSHMIAGRCMPGDVKRLLATLEAGFDAGMAQPPSAPVPDLLRQPPPFRRFAHPPAGSRLFAGPPHQAAALGRLAREARTEGSVVTLMILSPTALRHRVRFGDDGIWRQSGGTWGRSIREGPPPRWCSRDDRIATERQRIAAQRGLSAAFP